MSRRSNHAFRYPMNHDTVRTLEVLALSYVAYRALPFPLPVVPPKFTPENVGAQNRRLASKLYAQFFAWPIERSVRIPKINLGRGVWVLESSAENVTLSVRDSTRPPLLGTLTNWDKKNPQLSD